MAKRWQILFVLFFARMTMSFQFESIAALSPIIAKSYQLDIADIGLLIGLYLMPGVVVAIPGGAIAARFGDKRVIGVSMILMLAGVAMVGWGPGWTWWAAGRVLSGVGGVMVNIVMTKLLMDWFVGAEISTAMAIFINSWPMGIALSLLTMPGLAKIGGLPLVWAAVMAVIAVGLLMFSAVYRAPPVAVAAATRIKVSKLPYLALFLAAGVWALYNAALLMVFSFGPAFLTGRGWDLSPASSATSVFIIATAIGVPIGGFVADWTRQRDGVIVASLLSFAVVLPLVVVASDGMVPVILAGAGLVFGLGAGPIVSLPSMVLTPENRAFGTGVYYSIYYAMMMAAPALGGAVAVLAGDVSATFILSALLTVLAAGTLGVFRRATASRGVGSGR
jgi:MFS family permease